LTECEVLSSDGRGRAGGPQLPLRREVHGKESQGCHQAADPGGQSQPGSAHWPCSGASTKLGDIVPAEITIYQDNSFTFLLKTPPAPDLLRKAAGIDKGSSVPNLDKVGTISRDQLKEIAEIKMQDLNAIDLEGAMRQIEGTARSMGIDIR
jgi:hypothetical protein